MDDLVRRLEAAEAKALEWQRAITAVTPGGSEYCDPSYCAAWLRMDRDYGIQARKDRVLLQREVEAQAATIEALRGALAPFDEMASEMFARNWNASDVALELYDGDTLYRVTAGDFFAVRAALALCQPKPATYQGTDPSEDDLQPMREARYEDRYAGPKAAVATPKEKGRD